MSQNIPQDNYVKAGDINTRFWSAGDKGSTVILVHGLGGSVESWMYNIGNLAQHHRVFAIDLPGFGLSDKTLNLLTISYGARFIKDFMDTQDIDTASLIGNSLGGGITLQFAIQFPDRTEKIVLVNSVGLGRELALILRLSTLPLIGEYLTRPYRKGTVRLLLKRCVYDPEVLTDEIIEYTYQHAIRPGAHKCFLSTLRWVSNVNGQRTKNVNSILNNLASLSSPTLILWGKQDRMIPVSHAYVAEKSIPNAELHILDPCGHSPQIERPEEFKDLVLNFLTQ
ncbi:MAG TPA: alpha/beta fold hydrolase [Dehalococcoidia bacterium]|nr:alpha/beta fold hydrolase [Dehalococcoidia bacterium]